MYFIYSIIIKFLEGVQGDPFLKKVPPGILYKY